MGECLVRGQDEGKEKGREDLKAKWRSGSKVAAGQWPDAVAGCQGLLAQAESTTHKRHYCNYVGKLRVRLLSFVEVQSLPAATRSAQCGVTR